jgi:hypothetical protein
VRGTLPKIGGNAEHTPDRLGLLLENTERHLVGLPKSAKIFD